MIAHSKNPLSNSYSRMQTSKSNHFFYTHSEGESIDIGKFPRGSKRLMVTFTWT